MHRRPSTLLMVSAMAVAVVTVVAGCEAKVYGTPPSRSGGPQLTVVAPLGTAAVILDALQPVGVAAIPLNVTLLVPCTAPKFAPMIVTGVPMTPDVGLKLVTVGTLVSEVVNVRSLLTAALLAASFECTR